MDDVIDKLRQVEANTDHGLSQMLIGFKDDYQKSVNAVYDLVNSDKKFIDADSRDFLTDGIAKPGQVVDLAFKKPVKHDPSA